MEMPKELCESIIRSIEYVDDVSIRTDYSGRGMFGKSCFGLVGSSLDIAQVIAEVIKDFYYNKNEEFPDIVDILLTRQQQDSMGLNSIVYFPRLQWNKEVEVEEK